MKPIVAVSACVLGEPVRYNGGHTQINWITEHLSSLFELEGFCPEVMMGLGVPRETIRIDYDQDGNKNLIGNKSGENYNEKAAEISLRLIDQLKEKGISGIIWQSKSPSCGLERVKLHNPINSLADRRGMGIIVDFLLKAFPVLPMADSGRMHNSSYRESFMRKVYAFQEFEKLDKDINSLQEYHRQYKYILMELNQEKQKALGRIIASYDKDNLKEIFNEYRELFFSCFEKIPKKGHRLNVLQHLLGYLKNDLDASEKSNILEMFSLYHKGRVSYSVPLELLRFLVDKYQINYLLEQKYLSPLYRSVELEAK